MPEIRLDKLLSVAAGVSRSDAKKLLSSGAVCVDSAAEKSASARVDPIRQTVTLNGRPLTYREHLYIIMNKPLGVVSASECRDCETVLDILPEELFRKGLFPAGRLDKYTSGMLIITDDGAFSHRLLAPVSHLPKVYEFELDAPIVDKQLAEKFSQGVYLGGGEYSSPAVLEIESAVSGRVTIYEGIYHQVRRMFDQNGGHVTRLRRVQIGDLTLPASLKEGESRLLTDGELKKLSQKSGRD